MVRRREFIGLIGGAAVWPLSARSQGAAKVPRIGVLWHAANADAEAAFMGPLRQGFTDLGYVIGKTVVFEDRYPDEKPDLFNSLAAELVALKVDVLIADNIPAVLALQKATSTIPIIFIGNPDPVGFKIVSSLARPGGNITGISSMATDLLAKRVQLFKEAIPNMTRLALLLNPVTTYDQDRSVKEYRTIADQLRVSVDPVTARTPAEIDTSFATIAQGKFDGVIVAQHAMYFAEKKRIADLALVNRLPTSVPSDVFTDVGAFMYYGANWPQILREAATYAKKILAGEKTAELPVQQPTKFDLVFNLKTAKVLGLTVPELLLARADRVIE